MASIAPIFVPVAKRSNAELVTENTQLRQEVATLKKENANLKSQLGKRKADASTTTSIAGPSKKAKTPGQRKKLFEKWAKAAVRESAKCKLTTYDGCMPYDATVKESSPWTMEDFQSVFGDQNGTKLQPTPENKPTSQITIMAWENYEKIKALFGDANITQDGYKAQAWKKRNFMKSWRAGDWKSTLTSLEVHYHKSKMTVHLKFSFITGEDGYE